MNTSDTTTQPEPFDLEQFKSGRKAITRDWRIAEFLYYNERLAYPLGAIIGGNNFATAFTKDGHANIVGQSALDLTGMAPDPYAELKAARKAGKMIQFRRPFGEWSDMSMGIPDWYFPVGQYRIKPEPPKQPRLVPLTADDIPPGSIMRNVHCHPDVKFWAITSVNKLGIVFNSVVWTWDHLFIPHWEIKRPGEDWRLCSKEEVE